MARGWISPCLIYVYMYLVSNLVLVCSSYMTTGSGTWAEMTKNCTLATPEITFSEDENTITLGPGMELQDRERLWVGYTQDYEVFRYIGCIPYSEVTPSRTFVFEPDVGKCYSACDTNYIGLKAVTDKKMVECMCTNQVPRLLDTIPCGTSTTEGEFNYGGSSNVSIYTRASQMISNDLKGFDSWKEESTNCLCYYNPVEVVFKWVQCGTSYSSLCTTGNEGDHMANASSFSGSWSQSSDRCLRKGLYLSGFYENINTTSKAPLWMAYIKAKTVSTKRDPYYATLRRYGYIENVEGSLILKFGKGNVTLHAMCTNAAAFKAVDASSNKIGVYVGVPFGIVLVAVAIVLAVIIWKRRHARKPADATEVGNSIQNLTVAKCIVNSSIENSGLYNEIDLSNSSKGHYEGMDKQNPTNPNNNANNQYFILEKDSNSHIGESINSEANAYAFAKETGPNTTTSGRDDYDYAKETKPIPTLRTGQNSGYELASDNIQAYPAGAKAKRYEALDYTDCTEHVYNKAGVERKVNEDYDHITRGHVGAGDAVGENEYDTTSHTNIPRYMDNDYDTTSQVKMNSDPTYDHT